MPEDTGRTVRIPVSGEEGKHQGHSIRTINVSRSEGIKALYCITDKKIMTYLFAKNKGWTMEEAKKWVDEHTKRLVSTREIVVDQVKDFLKLTVTYSDGETKIFEPNSPPFILGDEKVLPGEDNNMVKCGECGHEFDWGKEPEVSQGLVKCPKCGMKVDQEGNMPKGKSESSNGLLEIIKIDAAKRTVYGVFLVPEIPDHDGDVISIEDIEKVAHGFMADYRTIDEMHQEVIKADIVESCIAWQDELDFHGKKLNKGTWFGTVKVYDDAVWAKVQSGEYKGFSVRISGLREPFEKGGAGSGNYGHAGRPGERGGSGDTPGSGAGREWRAAGSSGMVEKMPSGKYAIGGRAAEGIAEIQNGGTEQLVDNMREDAITTLNDTKAAFVDISSDAKGTDTAKFAVDAQEAIDDAKLAVKQDSWVTGRGDYDRPFGRDRDGNSGYLDDDTVTKLDAIDDRLYAALDGMQNDSGWVLSEKHQKGGSGSGNFGHAGRPGERGGSGEGGGGSGSGRPQDRRRRSVFREAPERVDREVAEVLRVTGRRNRSSREQAEAAGRPYDPNYRQASPRVLAQERLRLRRDAAFRRRVEGGKSEKSDVDNGQYDLTISDVPDIEKAKEKLAEFSILYDKVVETKFMFGKVLSAAWMPDDKVLIIKGEATIDEKGSAGSGNFGHAGRPGERGGSGGGGGAGGDSRRSEDMRDMATMSNDALVEREAFYYDRFQTEGKQADQDMVVAIRWEQRVRAEEAKGATRSDAQGIVDAEDSKAGRSRR